MGPWRMAVTSRREFIQIASVAALTPALPGWAAPPVADLTVSRVLCDSGLPASREFAQALQQRGYPVLTFNRSVTAIWFSEIYPHWMHNPIAIAGMTDPYTWFLMDLMGTGVWLQTVYYAAFRASSPASPGAGSWARTQAAILASAPRVPLVHDAWPSAIQPAASTIGECETLVCWALAPQRATRRA